MSEKVTGKAFDLKLFRRLMIYMRSYRLQFIVSTISVLSLAGLAAIYPVLLRDIVNEYILNKDAKLLLYFCLILLGVQLLQVIFQLLYIYFTNWLGQYIIKDIRTELFARMLRFKMQYFNSSPVGRSVTRVVSDTETIASIFYYYKRSVANGCNNYGDVLYGLAISTYSTCHYTSANLCH